MCLLVFLAHCTFFPPTDSFCILNCLLLLFFVVVVAVVGGVFLFVLFCFVCFFADVYIAYAVSEGFVSVFQRGCSVCKTQL